jgi:hypothetical protein
MDLKSLFKRKGKKTVDARGGAESLKADPAELKDIASGDTSVAEKTEDATESIGDPGAPGEAGGPADQGPH